MFWLILNQILNQILGPILSPILGPILGPILSPVHVLYYAYGMVWCGVAWRDVVQ